jgi:hypothetical protein
MFIKSINMFRFCWLKAPIQSGATEMLFGADPEASGGECVAWLAAGFGPRGS